MQAEGKTKGLDGQSEPIWTKDIAQRGAVFTHPRRCYRSGISYNAGFMASDEFFKCHADDI